LHHEELDELKVAQDSNAITEFDKFVSTFVSDKNVANRKIFNFFNSINDELKNLIKMNNDRTKIKYKKVEDNVEIIKNEYKESKYEDEENNNENEVKHKIIMLLD